MKSLYCCFPFCLSLIVALCLVFLGFYSSFIFDLIKTHENGMRRSLLPPVVVEVVVAAAASSNIHMIRVA